MPACEATTPGGLAILMLPSVAGPMKLSLVTLKLIKLFLFFYCFCYADIIIELIDGLLIFGRLLSINHFNNETIFL